MEYQEGINRIKSIERTIETLKLMLGEGVYIDKNYFSFDFATKQGSKEPEIKTDSQWDYGIIYVSGQYGYYGQSGCYDVINAEIVKAICDALQAMEKSITQKAVQMLEDEKNKIAKLIKKDAMEVLKIIEENGKSK